MANIPYPQQYDDSFMNIFKKIIDELNSMGYTYDQAIQKANKILEEAKKTNDINEDVQKQIDDLILSAGESDAEVIQARGDYSLLKDRLNSHESQLSKVENHEKAMNYYWKPEPQPSARVDEPGYFTDGFNHKFQDYIDELFEPIRQANTDYINRSSLGKDESGVYDIWLYDLKPENPEKTIAITGALHGSEVTLVLAMARFLKYLTEDYKSHPGLSYIRERVRILFIPFANPWGTSQTPRTRHNSNGVDLNRNWSYNWQTTQTGSAPFEHGYKGPEPFSEVETRILRDLFHDYPETIAHMDLHNTGGSSDMDYFVYLPHNFKYKTYEQLAEYFTRGMADPNINIVYSGNAMLSSYKYNVDGIVASTPEWADGGTGEAQYGAHEMTKALEWVGNVIIENVRAFDGTEGVAIEETTLTNLVDNADFSDGDAGWTGSGMHPPTISNNEYVGVLTGGASTPSIYRPINKVLNAGDKVYAKAKIKPSETAHKIEIRIRDFDANLTKTIASKDIMGESDFIELEGHVTLENTSNDAHIQVMLYYTMDNGDYTGAEVAFKDIMMIVDNAHSESDLKAMLNRFDNRFFTGTANAKYIKNSHYLKDYEKAMLLK